MYILGIETATKTGSVAIVSDNGVVASYTLNLDTTHSERLMATIDRVLADTGLTVSRMDAFAVSVGPGSFTGLRIGIATVKGLVLATGKPIAAVPTLLALARNLPYAAHPVCPILEARKNEFYAALYVHEGGDLAIRLRETIVPLEHLAEHVQGKTIFTGEAVLRYRSDIERLLGDRALFAPQTVLLPSAAVIAEIGHEMISANACANAEELTPLYLRRPEAEVVWEKRSRSK